MNSSWLGTDYDAYVDRQARREGEAPCLENILVVDDDDRMRNSVVDLLRVYGHACKTATNGREALDMLASQTVDLLLLDLNMPQMDGYEVIRQVNDLYPGTDVIIVSAETSFDSARQVLRCGAKDFLRKPYLPDDLIRAIENIAHKRQLQQQMDKMHRQLLASEQRHRFIVNNSPDIIYMLDGDGCFSFVNERITTLLGYRQNEVIGRHFSELVHPEDSSHARYAFAERRTGNRASYNVEFRLRHKDRTRQARLFESHSVTIELSAMGIYTDDQARQGREFVGTYGVARDISERKRAEEMINFQLYHDLLTKLPNRALFRDRLELAVAQAVRNKSQLAVMYLDMDRFKVINDSLGHLVGDKLLQVVATLLRGCIRESDTLARVGGDEFNLLLPEIQTRADAARIADKILSRMQQPISLEGLDVFVGFSIGIALFPGDGDTIDDLIRHADTAMYHVKARGKNAYQFYSTEMKTLHSRHLTLESGLRRALEEGQLQVYFQPQFNTESNRVQGVEALLRWEHPEEGMILPGEFIPLAEETGLIYELGRWVLERSCQTLRQWIDNGIDDLVVAINVSSRELMQTDFTAGVIETLNRYQIPGAMLELEITENVLMQDMEQAVKKLKELANVGVRIAVDDFGTGYSSLSYLQSLPLHTLKIDRSFISKIQQSGDRSSIVKAIVAMAKGLGLDLIAEGIETEVQLDYLRELDCSTVQGFLIGRPQPPAELYQQLLA